MAHARQQIRDAVVTAVTGLSTTGARVYPSRVHPLAKDFAPSLLVYTGDEEIEAHGQGRPVSLMRSLEVIVDGRAGDVDAAAMEQKLDAIANDVEAALGVATGTAPLGGLVLNMQITGIEVERDGEGDRPMGAVRLAYSILYRTADAAPGTIIS